MLKSYLYVFVNIFVFTVLTQKSSVTISLLELITSLLNKIKDKNVNIDEIFVFTVRYFSNIDVYSAVITSNILLKHNIIIKLCYRCKAVLESKKIITPFMYGGERKEEFPLFWLEFGKINIFTVTIYSQHGRLIEYFGFTAKRTRSFSY